MRLLLHSTGLSFLVHASLVVVLCAVPLATVERFTTAGRRNVIAIEMSMAAPAAVAIDGVAREQEIPPVSPASEAMAPTKPEAPPDRLIDPGPSSRAASEVQPGGAMHHPAGRGSESGPAIAPLQRRAYLPPERPPAFQEDPPPTAPAVPPRTLARRASSPNFSAAPVDPLAGLSERTPADFSDNRPPEYPQAAIRRGVEGVVMLRLQIDATGRVQEVQVIDSSGHADLDRAAIDAVRAWTGKPARRYGRAIPSEEVLPIRFRL